MLPAALVVLGTRAERSIARAVAGGELKDVRGVAPSPALSASHSVGARPDSRRRTSSA